MSELTIGGVRLILGDCLAELPRIADGSIDMILTDPPYGHRNNDGDLIHNIERARGLTKLAKESRPIANDDAESAADCFGALLDHAPRLLAQAGCCCCCCSGGGGPDPQFARWAMALDQSLAFKQMVVWDKGKMGLGWHYRRSYECILVAEKRGAGRKRWFDETRKVENIIRPGDYGIKKIIPKSTDHPTPKPVALAEHFLRLHSKPGDLVLDPFMGAGWVAEACVRLGRRFVGVEIDHRWYDMAAARVTRAVASTTRNAG